MERSQSNSKTEKGVDMAGLYGDWEADMGQGVDEAQAKAASALEEKPKKKKRKRKIKKATSTGPVAGTEYKVIKGEDRAKTKASKKAAKAFQRRDNPYKGWKSDLAWIEKQKKKKK
jgi:hypothetical protein